MQEIQKCVEASMNMGRGTSRNRSSLVIFPLGKDCLVQSMAIQDLDRADLTVHCGEIGNSSCVEGKRFAMLSMAEISEQFDRAIAAVNIVL
jgi:hypothetical protein